MRGVMVVEEKENLLLTQAQKYPCRFCSENQHLSLLIFDTKTVCSLLLPNPTVKVFRVVYVPELP